MRTLRLARIAAEAEGIRLRQKARRTAIRMTLGCIAMVFLFAALVFAHIAAWFSLRLYWQPPGTALAIAGGDIMLAAVIAVAATRDTPTRVEREALAMRQQAWESAVSRLGYSTLIMELVRIVTSHLWRSRSRS